MRKDMKRSDHATIHFQRRRQMLQAAAAALISVGTRSGAQGAAKPLQVGGLPVTCNLTLPVACMASATDANVAKGAGSLFEFSKYSGWHELKESLMSGRLQAA